MIVYLLTLVATIVIETAIVLAMNPRDRARLKYDAPLINLLTHPIARLMLAHTAILWGVLEALIVVVEAALYRSVSRLPLRQAVLTSVVANGVTIVIALLLPL